MVNANSSAKLKKDSSFLSSLFNFMHTFKKWMHKYSKANSIYFIKENRKKMKNS